MYEVTNTPAQARTSNLNEELGQVIQIFSYSNEQIHILFVNKGLCCQRKVTDCSVKLCCVLLSFLIPGEVHLFGQDWHPDLQRHAV